MCFGASCRGLGMTRRASLFTGRLRRRQTMVTRHLLPRSFQVLTPGASWVFVRLSCGVLLGSLFVATMPGAFCASCRIDCSRRCRCTPLSSGPNGTGMRRPSGSRRFLPHIDNWATCDQLPIKALGCRPEETLARVERWLASGRCYTMRFAIRALMVQFLDERFEPRFLDMVAEAHLVIRKAIESRRVSAEMKEQLRELRKLITLCRHMPISPVPAAPLAENNRSWQMPLLRVI